MQMIDIAKLTPHPRNKEFFDDIHGEKWEDFKKSVVRRGIVESIVVTQDLMIVSGHQRVNACKELGIIALPCRVVHYPEEDEQTGNHKEDLILEDLISTNIMQRGVGNVNPMKMAKCIVELERIYGIKNGGKNFGGNQHGRNEELSNNFKAPTQEDLAKHIGVTTQQLHNYKNLLNLIPDIQELVEQDKIKPTVAYKILAKLSEEEQEALIEKLGDKTLSKMTQKEVESAVKLYKEEKEKLEQELNGERKAKQALLDTIESMKNQKPQTSYQTVEVTPVRIENELKNLKDKLKQGDDEKNNISKKVQDLIIEKQKIEDEKRKLEDYIKSEDHKLERLKKEKEKLELEGHISISNLQIGIHKFIEEYSPSVFLQGAVASSAGIIKDDLLDSVVALEEFTSKLREILDSKIDTRKVESIEAKFEVI